jgi:chromosome segregation ATPase
MDDEKKPCPYEEVTGKIDTIEDNLVECKQKLEKLKELLDEADYCLDEIESEKALQSALDNYFADELLKLKPAGDA